MQGNVISFNIDHRKLKPGVYLHEVKKIDKNHFVTTFDLRFKCPNHGDYLTPTEVHTIEHVVATFFSEHCIDKLYFGPMGCFTGFYLLLANKHTVKDVISYFPKLDQYWRLLVRKNIVPAKTPLRCGNYKLLDIKAGYKAWHAFYISRKKWGKSYTLIKKNGSLDESKYQDQINYQIALKH
ncbi:MAG: S-ribosylhomocysteine lyase [Bacilli bacterium]|nr:S-ribosylhomocysteine lyase [Bacilli bacterium]